MFGLNREIDCSDDKLRFKRCKSGAREVGSAEIVCVFCCALCCAEEGEIFAALFTLFGGGGCTGVEDVSTNACNDDGKDAVTECINELDEDEDVDDEVDAVTCETLRFRALLVALEEEEEEEEEEEDDDEEIEVFAFSVANWGYALGLMP